MRPTGYALDHLYHDGDANAPLWCKRWGEQPVDFIALLLLLMLYTIDVSGHFSRDRVGCRQLYLTNEDLRSPSFSKIFSWGQPTNQLFEMSVWFGRPLSAQRFELHWSLIKTRLTGNFRWVWKTGPFCSNVFVGSPSCSRYANVVHDFSQIWSDLPTFYIIAIKNWKSIKIFKRKIKRISVL